LLKYPRIKHITLVDLDPAMVKLGRSDPRLTALNKHSLSDPRVETVAADAMVFLENTHAIYDTIIADLPDPNNVSLARLYSREFYRLIRQHLAAQGVFVTQATSPYYAPRAYWAIVKSIKAAGYQSVVPY